MMEFSIITVSAFVATLNEITKAVSKDVFKKDINRFIPLFSIGYGLALGLVAWFTKISGFGNNAIEAAFIGLSSGAAATGYHQIGKQLWDKPPDSEESGYEDVDGVEEIDATTPQSDFDLLDVTDVDDSEEDEEEDIITTDLPEGTNIDVEIK